MPREIRSTRNCAAAVFENLRVEQLQALSQAALPPGPFEKALALKSELIKPRATAELLGRSSDFIYALIDEGKIEAFEPSGRKVKRKTLTRRSVLMVLAESGSKKPEIFLPRMNALLAWLSLDSLDAVIREGNRLLEKSGLLPNTTTRRRMKPAPY